jgi:large subunit ribosomal protein L23
MAKKVDKTENSALAYRVLIEPWITEEATRVAELNKYIFKVSTKSRKEEIKRAVESTYKVEVASVNTINVSGKKRLRGKIIGRTSAYKKAIVSVKEGGKIEFFESK